MFIDTGIRASELTGLSVDDVDLRQQIALVMGKGGRARVVPFGIKTTDALRRYLKARRQHHLAASTPALWLGRKGPLTVSGVAQLLERRGEDAGVDHLHPHRSVTPWRTAGYPRWTGTRSDEARRLAYAGDGRPVRRERC
jgi:site-specific recombinase XerD